MRAIIEYFIDHPRIVNLLIIFVFLVGGIRMVTLQNSGYPAVDFGMVNITTVFPGASPEDVETKVTSKIEEELLTVDGIDEIHSASVENVSRISVLIEESADYEQVVNDIQKAVDKVDDLPEELPDKPDVEEVNNDRVPVAEIAITGPADYALKRQYALALQKRLQSDSNVGTVMKLGYLDREVLIKADQKKLAHAYLSLAQLMDAIRNNNVRLPSGELKRLQGEKNIVVDSEFDAPVDVKNVVIRSGFDGNRIVLSDVALVEEGYDEPGELYKYGGESAIILFIQKKADADILETAHAIEDILNQFKKSLPDTVHVERIADYSQEVKSLLRLVIDNGILGLVLVIISVIAFLNLRAAFWTVLGIPISILMAVSLFATFGVTINFISLMAMIIVLGMLVDDAIVVAENIYRYREEGVSAREAAITGTLEVMWPVIATVSTTIVAFAPLLAMTGVMGKFMWQMPIVVTLTLLASLIEALFFLPAHIAHSKIPPQPKKRRFSVWPKIETGYQIAVEWTLKHRFKTLFIFIGTFVFSIVLLVTQMTFILFDSPDGLYGTIKFETPRGSSLEFTEQKSREIEAILDRYSKDEMLGYVTTIGERRPKLESYGAEVNHSAVGNVFIHFTPMKDRERTSKEIMHQIRDELKPLTGFERLEADVIQDGPPVGKPITVSIVSNDDTARRSVVDQLIGFLKQEPGVYGVENTETLGKEQVKITFDTDVMNRLGITPAAAAATIQAAYDGVVVSQIRNNGEDVDYRVTLQDSYKTDLGTLDRLTIMNPNGKLIELREFVKVSVVDDVLVINHFDGDRSQTIYGELDTEINTSLKVNQKIKEMLTPLVAQYPDMRVVFGGEEKDTQEAMQSLFVAMILALVGIYFILVMLFNSYTQPFLVMSAIPFTFTGIVFAFFLRDMVFGFVALIGLIGLTGVVVNNSLIMLSFIKQQVASEGFSVASIATAAQKRLRPVVLTTVTTAAGLFPTAYGFGGDNAFLVPMINAIAWGLIFASVITLFLIPSLYWIHYRIMTRLGFDAD